MDSPEDAPDREESEVEVEERVASAPADADEPSEPESPQAPAVWLSSKRSRTAALAEAALLAVRRGTTADDENAAARRREAVSRKYRSGEMRRPGGRSTRSAIKMLFRSGELSGLRAWGEVATEILRLKWDKVVGEMFAPHTWPDGVQNDVLYVLAEDRAWADQLVLHGPEILKRASRAVASRSTFSRVQARVGTLPPAAARGATTASVLHTAEDEKSLRAWEAKLTKETSAAIPDRALRERVVSWLARQAVVSEIRDRTDRNS